MDIKTMLANAGVDLSDPAVAKALRETAKEARDASAGATEEEEKQRQLKTEMGLLAGLRGDPEGFENTPANGDAASQATVRCIVRKDGTRAIIAKLKIAGVQAPQFVNLIDGGEASEASYNAAKREHNRRS